MVFLIYHLIIIFSHADLSGYEKFSLKIINCVNENEDLVCTGFFRNELSCEMKLKYNDLFWSINVYLYIGIIPFNLNMNSICSFELVKYNENMGLSGYDNDFVLYLYDEVERIKGVAKRREERNGGYIETYRLSYRCLQLCKRPNDLCFVILMLVRFFV
ncbi:hypothetical protein CDIK_1466 [Cucumispora dikerogammari]|nr:hypothetical protein CDIK_1466 [Cucumispora dikerogammari]